MAQLNSIWINNYRSLSGVELEVGRLDDHSATYGLIGLNEAGKSSILKALTLLDPQSTVAITGKDFFDKTSDIDVGFEYGLSPEEFSAAFAEANAAHGAVDPNLYDRTRVTICISFAANSLKRTQYLALLRSDGEWDYKAVSSFPAGLAHKPILWAASDQFLISRPIDLTAFAQNPLSSIPLRNCFLLAGISDAQIPSRIASLQADSTEIEFLHEELSRSVTEHIKAVWPNHPIKISFLISNNQIHFHVKDLGAAGRAKTADQRSDGFKQFVSFLLTVSAQNQNQELSNSLLLLDEPETHLHPVAQEYLLGEIVRVTKNDRNNVALFATHSNHMIDKNDLSRYYRITKSEDQSEVHRFDKKTSSYASVSYNVFSVASVDYHTELYARLHERFQDQDSSDEKRARISRFDEEVLVKSGQKKTKPLKGVPNSATLTTYIRNCIHHPDNGDKFTQTELQKSIQILEGLLK